MGEPTGSHPAVVHLENVTFSFGGGPVLRDIFLNVAEREFVVVVGKSGSGKSTLLKVVDGLLAASGTVQVRGRVRMVFQEDRLFPWYRVKQNVAVAVTGNERQEESGDLMTPSGHADESIPIDPNEKAQQLLAELGISHFARRYPHELSGGERQRVSIARAFAANPQIVLMDEPFGSLDVLTREEMQAWLLDFWQRNRAAVIFVTHDVEEALILGDRILVLLNGQLHEVCKFVFPRPREQKLRYTQEFLDAKQRVREQLAD